MTGTTSRTSWDLSRESCDAPGRRSVPPQVSGSVSVGAEPRRERSRLRRAKAAPAPLRGSFTSRFRASRVVRSKRAAGAWNPGHCGGPYARFERSKRVPAQAHVRVHDRAYVARLSAATAWRDAGIRDRRHDGAASNSGRSSPTRIRACSRGSRLRELCSPLARS